MTLRRDEWLYFSHWNYLFLMQNEIKDCNRIYWEKKIDSILQDFIRIWTSEKYKKAFLIFFKVKVYNVASSFSVCSCQTIAEISCRLCPQEKRVSCRSMAAHELPLLSDVCWFSLSESEVMMNMCDWLAICFWCSMWHIVSSETHEKPSSSACFPGSATIWSPRKAHHTCSLLIIWTHFLKLHC